MIVALTLTPLAVRELPMPRLRVRPLLRLTALSTPRSIPPSAIPPPSGTETVVCTVKTLNVGSCTVVAGKAGPIGC